MKIKQVHIYNFGKWHAANFSFKTQLEILYGPNEAGKTTLLNFIQGVLFGFLPRRSSHKDYIPTNAKNYGGELTVTVDGHDYLVERRSGKHGGTLRIMTLAGKLLPNQTLTKWLGHMTRTTFQQIFCFGNVDLRNVTKLKKANLIQQIQRLGMVNSGHWLRLQAQLKQDNKHLYSPTGYKPILNQTLKQYRHLQLVAKGKRRDYQAYLHLQQQIQIDQNERKLFQKKLQKIKQTGQKLHQEQNNLIQAHQLQALKKSAEQPVKSGFTATDQHKLVTLQARLTKLQNQLAVLQHQQKVETQQIIPQKQLDQYLQHRSLISHLQQNLAQVQKQINSFTAQKTNIEQIQERLASLKDACVVQGRVLKPLLSSDAKQLKQQHQALITKRRQLTALQNRRIEMEKLLEKQRHQHALWKSSKRVPGIGLLTFQLSLIPEKDLKSAKQHGTQTLDPEKLQEQIKTDQQGVQRLTDEIHQLLTRYHYQLDAGHDVNTWLGMQNNLQTYQKGNQRLQHFQQQLVQQSTKLKAFFAAWQFLPLQSNRSWSDQFIQIQQFIQASEKGLQQNRHLEADLQHLSEKIESVRSQQKHVNQQLKAFYRQRQVQNEDEFRAELTKVEQHAKDQASYQMWQKKLGPQRMQELQKPFNAQQISQKVQGNQNTVVHLNKQLQEAINRQTSDQAKLKALVEDGTYDHLQQQLANLRTRILHLTQRWLVKQLAQQWIGQALLLANQKRLPHVEKLAETNFQTLTNGHYEHVVFNKTGLKVMNTKSQRLSLIKLSKGTLQQLYLAIIFAFMEAFGHRYNLPMLIDDGFTDFDITRRKATWHLLKLLSQDRQIIYCTSDNQVQMQLPVDHLLKSHE